QRVRAQITEALVSAFANVDVIVTPTSATTAQRFANEQVNPDAGLLTDSMLTAANLSGMPALSVPVGVAQDGLPVGLQVIAPTFEDARAYRVGAAFEHLVAARDGAPFWQSIPALSGKASA
ncbi:MAG: amidase family protein, partial [Microbacteriaceae bacterium]